jgi:hypothetical protein
MVIIGQRQLYPFVCLQIFPSSGTMMAGLAAWIFGIVEWL